MVQKTHFIHLSLSFPKYGDADGKGSLGIPGKIMEDNTKTDQGSVQRRGVQRERSLL